MYDGYEKYGSEVAASYEEDRRKEPIWWQEEAYLTEYFSGHNPQTILDAPVGTGRFFERYGGAKEVVGIDISEEMLEQSSRKLNDLGLATIKLVRGDIFNLDFPDNHFDLTVCWRFAHLVPEKLLTDALRELARVTRGEILLQTYVYRPYCWRLAVSLLRSPAKIVKRVAGTSAPPLPWGHIRAYFHTHATLASKTAEAGLILKQRSQIGAYNDSTVHVYHLSKPTAP